MHITLLSLHSIISPKKWHHNGTMTVLRFILTIFRADISGWFSKMLVLMSISVLSHPSACMCILLATQQDKLPASSFMLPPSSSSTVFSSRLVASSGQVKTIYTCSYPVSSSRRLKTTFRVFLKQNKTC